MNIRGMQKYKKYATVLMMLLIAAALTFLAASGLFGAVDQAASDAFYQSRSASDGVEFNSPPCRRLCFAFNRGPSHS